VRDGAHDAPGITLGLAALRDRAAGYLAVTKPRIVALIVFTALVGMLVSVPDVPPPVRVLVACLGIGLAAAGAAAFNHLLDRRLDGLMRRTGKRPLPSGRLSPLEVFLTGMVLSVLGTVLLWFRIGPLTAALTFASLIGYAVVYTSFLKHLTPQNIVIGGAAGAAPPVLGWVAMTGHVAPEALALFLIVFVWTPPHFWALALHRRGDYEKADIPMLPVTHGVDVTARSIFLYTVLLALVSLLPVVLGSAGLLYLLVALGLDAVFLVRAWGLWHEPRSAVRAQATFRFSITYLSLIFLALLADHYLGLVR
jgi:protoheme IX farnesyltransferase